MHFVKGAVRCLSIAPSAYFAILTIFIVAAITFFAMNAIPGGPFNKEKATSEAARRCWRRF